MTDQDLKNLEDIPDLLAELPGYGKHSMQKVREKNASLRKAIKMLKSLKNNQGHQKTLL